MKPLSTFSLILRDVCSDLFLRDMFCEFLGTLFFLFISLSSVVLWPLLAFGVSLALSCVCLGEVHLNPVVTLALVAGLRVSPWRAVLMVGAQLLGALSACALLLGITPTALRSNLGINEVAPGVYLYQALLVEMAVTFQLVLCVQAATHPKSAFSSVAPAVIGLSVTLALLAWVLHDLVLHPRWNCLSDWVTECKEVLLKDLSKKQPRGPENNMEA
ncbi:hypothetical protein ABG768_019248 [Culter alburnus]|uniref:Aquaporin 6 n=1 Tax=Culter alburnus TaxID=194366 RepID=A0AAW2AY17_CULAL